MDVYELMLVRAITWQHENGSGVTEEEAWVKYCEFKKSYKRLCTLRATVGDTEDSPKEIYRQYKTKLN